MKQVRKQEKHDIKTERKQNKQIIKKEKINKEGTSTKSVLMSGQQIDVAAACSSGASAAYVINVSATLLINVTAPNL
jgi:hypothetical protein